MPRLDKAQGFADRYTVNFIFFAIPVLHILFAHSNNTSVHAVKNNPKLIDTIHYFLEQHAVQYYSVNPYTFNGFGTTAFNLPSTETIADEDNNIMGAAYFIVKLITSGLSLVAETSDDQPKRVTESLDVLKGAIQSVFMLHDGRSPQMNADQTIRDLGKCVDGEFI